MEAKRSSYKKLFSNTLIIAFGSFSSKLLMLLLVSIYTRYLSEAELGVNDVIQQISNWLLPVVTMQICEAVMRFGLDRHTDNARVFTVGNAVCLAGFAGLGVILPIVSISGVADKYLGSYSLLIYIYIVAASLQLVYSYFLRAIDKVWLFAVSAIVNTVLTLAGTVLFIIVMKLGNNGYLYSIIAANLLSVLFMFIAGKLWRYIDFKHFDRALLRKMFSYSFPLIPAQLMWLVTNSSDTFMTTHYLGYEATGVLSQSYKIANVVATVYMMFGQAWNMSAVMEDESEDRDEFYGNVFHLNQCLMYILVAGCLLVCTPLTHLWMGEKLWVSATYAPILIYSTVFSCFTTFMGSIYLASNRTGRSLVTSLIAGVINISLNVILIPNIGLFGPPITTVVSYLAVFTVRAFDSRKIVPFKLGVGKLISNNILLLIMTFAAVALHTNASLKRASMVTLPVMFIIVTVCNIKPVWEAVMKICPAKIRGIIERLGTVKLVILAVLAAGYAGACLFLWHSLLWITLGAVSAAVMAYGITTDKRAFRLGGMAGLFAAVWAMCGVWNAFTALLLLSAAEYLRRPDDAVTFIGAVCLTGTLWGIGGKWLGLFAGDIILFIALIAGMKRFTAWLERLIIRAEERKKESGTIR